MSGVLGVDGGQSAIRLRHSSGERVVEVSGVSHMEGDTIGRVATAVADGWREGGFDPVHLVVLGLTTAPLEPGAADRLCGMVAAATGAAKVWLADDAVTSHAGALSMGQGISLVVGTGVACLANLAGRPPRVIGGHGFLLGDEGGAFWIGREGVRAVLRSADGRGTRTSLTTLAERRFGSLHDLHVRLHGEARPVDAIARFAPDVLTAARLGDPQAEAILAAATAELLLVAQVAAAEAAQATGSVPLALGGRLLEADSELRARLEDRLAADPIAFAVRSADGSPLDGALRLGLAGDPDAYPGLVHSWSPAGVAA